MKILSFNSKGGCGKSTIAREIVAGPNSKNWVIAEVDPLNRTQESYSKSFKNLINIDENNIKDLFIHINDNENIVIDIGADYIQLTMKILLEYDILSDIDVVIIPMTNGRTDQENALKTYNLIKDVVKKIFFAFIRYDKNEKLNIQYKVFYDNIKDRIIDFNEDMFIKMESSDIVTDAQQQKKLISELALDFDYKSKAFKEKKNNNQSEFHRLMRLELTKRSAQIYMKTNILPAHNKILGKLKKTIKDKELEHGNV